MEVLIRRFNYIGSRMLSTAALVIANDCLHLQLLYMQTPFMYMDKAEFWLISRKSFRANFLSDPFSQLI